MCRNGHDQAKCTAEKFIETQKRMAGEAGEKSAGASIAKPIGDRFGGKHRMRTEARHQPWMSRKARNRAQDFRSKLLPVFDKGAHQGLPGVAVLAEGIPGAIEIPFQDNRGSVVEGVSDGGGGVNPFEAMPFKRQGREEWRADAQGKHGGSEVVPEAGESDLHSG